ncbi:MAG: nucleotidyltransferase domain-containing protein [Saprospiraceae bacterium]|nr:nucleotidyltransferase domain-containing protein [Saprospiraceae bacterium]
MKYGLKDKTIRQIQGVFITFPQIEEVILYGSRAMNRYSPGSDIDLTIKGVGLSLSIVNTVGRMLDDLLLPYTFDISVYHHIKNPDLLDHINRVGLCFYRKQSELNPAPEPQSEPT